MSEPLDTPLLERRANERTLDAYQLAAGRTVNPALDDAHRFLDAAAGLSEEAGEVLAHARKHVLQGRPLDRDAVIDELGDALWCLAIAAKTLGVTLSGVAQRNEEKLRERHPEGFEVR
ncbi:MAG TPA: nucleoside triphosphate pyrophosphohydrolase family protein [Gemmatimonadaceae bacterium]|nr:nucleoside triphosphate pyrophosphohydrolase family protein [Gemmatimonadaceae bacterium]